MKVGVDNYALFPLDLNCLETLEWALKYGAEGVSFSGLKVRSEKMLDLGLLRDMGSYCQANNLYIEWGGGRHFGIEMDSWRPTDIQPLNRIVAQEASLLGAKIVRSCSGGLMRWNNSAPDTDTFMRNMATEIRKLKPVIGDFNISWAIETHFEFTSFELLRVFEMANLSPGEGIGICLDTMNLLIMLEDPVEATMRLLPWIISTHIKDGGIIDYSKGLISYPSGIGRGQLPLLTIIQLILSHNPEINLSIEDHNGGFELPISDTNFLSKFPDLRKSELNILLSMAQQNNTEGADIEQFTSRALWPEQCESRMIENIRQAKLLMKKL